MKADPPTLDDFLSGEAKGRPLLEDTPENRRLWRGVSVYHTVSQARRTARRFPALGHYIAELRIPETTPIAWEKTKGPGHYTLWGEPGDLLARVISIQPV